MVFSERITFFGDVKGVNLRDIRNFIEVTDYLYGGSYPSREYDLSDDEMERRTSELLLEVGISNPHPITLCSSIEERATQILQNCSLRRMQNGRGMYWIIDRDPHSLVEAFQSIDDKDNFRTDILQSTTVVKLDSARPLDYLDRVTGIRIVNFSITPYRFPTHPNPAS